MISDKELADAVIALGVGELNTDGFGYEIDEFVHEPRVAMALLNKVYDAYATLDAIDFEVMESPLERPIIEQCVEALS